MQPFKIPHVFIRKTGLKKKVSSTVHFPFVIDMSNYVKAQGVAQSNYTYDLSAVLIHRGPSAYSGHYVGKILLISTQFDGILNVTFFCEIRQHILRTLFQKRGTNSMTKSCRK